VLEDVEIDILDLLLIEVVLDHIEYFLVFEDLLVAVEDLYVLAQDQLVGDLQLLEVELDLLAHR